MGPRRSRLRHRPARQAAPGRVIASKHPRHEHAIGIGLVISERRALDREVAAIEGARRPEIIPGPGFQTEPRHAHRTRLGNDVGEHRQSRALVAHAFGGMHGFDFAMIARKGFQRTHAQQRLAAPNGPETNVWGFECAGVQGVGAARPVSARARLTWASSNAITRGSSKLPSSNRMSGPRLILCPYSRKLFPIGTRTLDPRL